MRKSTLLNFFLVCLSLFLTFCFCEYLFRKAIFSKNPSFEEYRKPGNYAKEWDEDFWKLYRLWGNHPQMKTDSILGWSYKFFPKTFFHPDFKKQKKRRPVLMYGDSFVACVDSTINGFCWDDYLNNDTLFSRKYFLYNYGIGAHGVDQTYTVMKNSFSHFPNPLVIFCIMTEDLDRSILNFREGQKPIYFIDEHNHLQFDNSKIEKDQYAFLIKNPPQIKSYLWRKFLFSDVNFLPKAWTEFLTGELSARKKAVALNKAILDATIETLRKSKTDFMFIVFHTFSDLNNVKPNWRDDFLKKFLDNRKAPYIWSTDVYADSIKRDSSQIYKYLMKGDGHPTRFLNQILSTEIRKRILLKKYESFTAKNLSESVNNTMYETVINNIMTEIKNDTSKVNEVKRISREQNKEFNDALYDYTLYYYIDRFEKN